MKAMAWGAARMCSRSSSGCICTAALRISPAKGNCAGSRISSGWLPNQRVLSRRDVQQGPHVSHAKLQGASAQTRRQYRARSREPVLEAVQGRWPDGDNGQIPSWSKAAV